MKRILKWFVVPMLLMALVLVVVANLLVDPAGTLSPPDPSLLITLPDGRHERLDELLERSAADLGQEESDEPEHDPPDGVAAVSEEPTVVEVDLDAIDIQQFLELSFELAPDETDVFRLGRHAMRAGRVDEALALLQSVPEDHDQYGTAQRFIGWELLTKQMDRPALGLAYMNRALDAGPLEGENWQDASRVYLRTLGIRWDPVNNVMR
jgi:hypothetical protein